MLVVLEQVNGEPISLENDEAFEVKPGEEPGTSVVCYNPHSYRYATVRGTVEEVTAKLNGQG